MSDIAEKASQATPAATLEQQILNPNHPKNEREWWAADEITRLRAEVEKLKAARDLVLGEAARVALDGPYGQPQYAWDYWCGYGNGKRAAAAAIRALKSGNDS